MQSKILLLLVLMGVLKRVIYYGINAAYETYLFPKQNMLFRFIDQTSAAMLSPSQGNLFFHGLTLQGFIDF